MKSHLFNLVAFGAFAVSLLPAVAEQDPKAAVIAALDKIGAADAFTIEVRRSIDADLQLGMAVPAEAEIELEVQRPDKLRAEIEGEGVDRILFFDGSHLTLVDEENDAYVRIEAKGDLDDLVMLVEEKLGFAPPLADLVVSDPKAAVLTEKTEMVLKGKEEFDGTTCLLIDGKDEEVSWSLWLDEEKMLPKKVHVVAIGEEGTPSLTVEFEEIDLDEKHEADDFTFEPSGDMKEAKIVSIDELPTEASEEEAK